MLALVVAGVLELTALRATAISVSVAVAVFVVVRGRELWRGCVTAVVCRAAGGGPAASGDEVVSACRVIGRRRAEARAELASSVASSAAAAVTRPAGVAVVVFVSVSQISRAGTTVRWSSVLGRTSGATVVRSSVSRTAVSCWARCSSVVLRPSMSCGSCEVLTRSASVVWSTMVGATVSEGAMRGITVSRTVVPSRTSEGCVRRTGVRAGFTESRDAMRRVRGASVRRWSVESSTSMVRGTSVAGSSVGDIRRSGTTMDGTSSGTSGAISGCSVSETTVGRSGVIAETTVGDVPVRKRSGVSGTMVGGTGVGSAGSSGERAAGGSRGISGGSRWA